MTSVLSSRARFLGQPENSVLGSREQFLAKRVEPSSSLSRRGYDAAAISRLYSDWVNSADGPNTETRLSLAILRARSRNLANNNDHVKRFLSLLTQNVIGDMGIRMLPDARNERGEPDNDANTKIANAWYDWCRKGICTADGRLSFRDAQILALKTVARDGENLVKHIRGEHEAGNLFAYAIQLLEPDHLDDKYEQAGYEKRVIMGVEVNRYTRPLAYYILTEHPNERRYGVYGYGRRQRIAADRILHTYIVERANQVRGIPWLHTAMRRLKMLGGYEEAELVAARLGASKMGFFKSADGSPPPIDSASDDGKGEFVHDAEPGIFSILPDGYDFEPFDPQHPNSSFDAFVKATLRGIASGLNLSYNSLANDLEGVNYSSLRQGALDDRDGWRCVQAWFIENYLQPIYEKWLVHALATQLQLPPRKMENYLYPRWKPRGWQWVDPQKEVNANVVAIQNGIKSRTDIHAERGTDIEDTFIELQLEQKLAEKHGISISGKPANMTPGDDDEEKNRNT